MINTTMPAVHKMGMPSNRPRRRSTSPRMIMHVKYPRGRSVKRIAWISTEGGFSNLQHYLNRFPAP